MATWKKILTEADAQKDLVTGSGLSGGVNNVLIGSDGDVTLAVDINGATDLGSGIASGDEILVADVNASNAIKKTTVGDIVNLASSGVSGNTFASDLKIGRDADNLIDFATADNEITFRANGSDVLELTNNSGDSILSLLTQDKNFQIKGNDGGSAILALDIDMAAAGQATFVGEVVAPSLDISGDVDVDGTLEADAITINGTAIASVLSPVAGNTSLVTTGALDTGSITSGFGNIDVGASSIAAGSFDASDGNITNVGSISLDAIIADGSAITIGTDTSGDTVTIGHTTSEVTIGDNLTVTGDLTVSGTTTTINTTNLEVEDHIILLGTNASPTADTGTLSGIEVETSGTASKRASIIWTKDLGASNDGTYDGSGTAVGLTGWSCTNHQESNQASFPIAVMEFSTNSTAPTSNSAGVGCFHYDTGDDKLYIRTA